MLISFISSVSYAGTGHTEDVDLAIFLFLLGLGFVIAVWEGIDYLKKNGGRLKRKIIQSLSKAVYFLVKRIRRNDLIYR